MFRLFILFISLFLGLIPSTTAQQIPVPTTAKLVSDVAVAKPGESFKIGVLFDIDPGWHIYWKKPGDTGLPTEVDFIVPANYKTGELIWPAPATFKNSRGGTDFGYENSVLLWVNILVPAGAKVNSSATFQSEVTWLSCKEICIPGKANLEYDLRIGDIRKAANITLFSSWQKRVDNK